MCLSPITGSERSLLQKFAYLIELNLWPSTHLLQITNMSPTEKKKNPPSLPKGKGFNKA